MRTTPEVMAFLKATLPEAQIAPWQVDFLRHVFAEQMSVALPDPRVELKRLAREQLSDYERYKTAFKIV